MYIPLRTQKYTQLLCRLVPSGKYVPCLHLVSFLYLYHLKGFVGMYAHHTPLFAPLPVARRQLLQGSSEVAAVVAINASGMDDVAARRCPMHRQRSVLQARADDLKGACRGEGNLCQSFGISIYLTRCVFNRAPRLVADS